MIARLLEPKLNDRIVRRIRAERALGDSIVMIAGRYGVSCKTVVRSLCGDAARRARPGLAKTRGHR